jgi:hypothetical protein
MAGNPFHVKKGHREGGRFTSSTGENVGTAAKGENVDKAIDRAGKVEAKRRALRKQRADAGRDERGALIRAREENDRRLKEGREKRKLSDQQVKDHFAGSGLKDQDWSAERLAKARAQLEEGDRNEAERRGAGDVVASAARRGAGLPESQSDDIKMRAGAPRGEALRVKKEKYLLEGEKEIPLNRRGKEASLAELRARKHFTGMAQAEYDVEERKRAIGEHEARLAALDKAGDRDWRKRHNIDMAIKNLRSGEGVVGERAKKAAEITGGGYGYLNAVGVERVLKNPEGYQAPAKLTKNAAGKFKRGPLPKGIGPATAEERRGAEAATREEEKREENPRGDYLDAYGKARRTLREAQWGSVAGNLTLSKAANAYAANASMPNAVAYNKAAADRAEGVTKLQVAKADYKKALGNLGLSEVEADRALTRRSANDSPGKLKGMSNERDRRAFMVSRVKAVLGEKGGYRMEGGRMVPEEEAMVDQVLGDPQRERILMANMDFIEEQRKKSGRRK